MGKRNVSKRLQKVIVEAMMPSAKRRTPSVSAFLESLDNIDEDCNNDVIEDTIDKEKPAALNRRFL